MGKRPPLDVNDAHSVLRGGDGRLRADTVIDMKIPLTRRQSIAFDAWLAMETDVLGALARGADPMGVLNVEPFPHVRGSTWKACAEEMLEADHDDTSFAAAVVWFAEGILQTVVGEAPKDRPRPWQASFDRAEARSGKGRRGQDVVNDWLADEIWSLEWTSRNWAHAKRDWATRIAISGALRRRFEALGAGEERAAAEAVTVIDTVGCSEWWEEIESAFVL